MQGYIININKVRDDDLIVSILSSSNIYTTYRFYGARHSTINIGYKIDFELETNAKSTMPRLKDVMEIAYPWITNKQKLYDWQQFIKLFYPHLRDIDNIDNFYLQLLDDIAHKLVRQNSKITFIQGYLTLLYHEGRLHNEYRCLLCDEEIQDNISIIRSFNLTHQKCSYSKAFPKKQINDLFVNQNLLNFEDDEIKYIWNILLQGF